MDSVKAELDEYRYVVQQQMKRIAELEAEVERLQAAGGAHSVLKNIYLDRELPESLRAKAATAALPHETLLMPERAPLELQAEPEKVSLFDLAERRRLKSLELDGRDIKVEPNGYVILLPQRNGDGQDD